MHPSAVLSWTRQAFWVAALGLCGSDSLSIHSIHGFYLGEVERERERAHRNSADMFPRVFRVTQHGCPVAFELIEALSELLRLHEEEPKT